MLVPPMVCPQCKASGRLLTEFNYSHLESEEPPVGSCQRCGSVVPIDDLEGQFMLSRFSPSTWEPGGRKLNTLRYQAIFNRGDYGFVSITPGHSKRVQFRERIDYPGIATVHTSVGPLIVREMDLSSEGVTILTSVPEHSAIAEYDSVEVFWQVYGLQGVEALPLWLLQFVEAVVDLEEGRYREALLGYAVAFESFIEELLTRHLGQQHGERFAEYLLKSSKGIEVRVQKLVHLQFGQRFSDNKRAFQAWKEQVQDVRNNVIAHGGQPRLITYEQAEAAHSATYQAIRWLRHMAGEPPVPGFKSA